jgi:hypothetical protein
VRNWEVRFASERTSPIRAVRSEKCQKQTFLLAQRDGQIDVISLCDANEGALYR